MHGSKSSIPERTFTCINNKSKILQKINSAKPAEFFYSDTGTLKLARVAIYT